jgi:hypothetical protein
VNAAVMDWLRSAVSASLILDFFSNFRYSDEQTDRFFTLISCLLRQ